MTLPILAPKNFRIIAHRGASAYAPENTRAAIKLAVAMNVREFEIDTQLTADGQAVICHELNLEKYDHPNMIVEAMTWEQLKQLDMGSWFSPYLFREEKMVKLSELFDEYKNDVIYHIEIKGKAGGLPQQICNVIQDFDVGSNCVITSFSLDALRSIQFLNPKLALGWLINSITTEVLSVARDLKLVQICPRADSISKEQVELALKTVSEVRAWGVNGNRQEVIALIRRIIDSSCNGMTINWPDWVKHQGTT